MEFFIQTAGACRAARAQSGYCPAFAPGSRRAISAHAFVALLCAIPKDATLET